MFHIGQRVVCTRMLDNVRTEERGRSVYRQVATTDVSDWAHRRHRPFSKGRDNMRSRALYAARCRHWNGVQCRHSAL